MTPCEHVAVSGDVFGWHNWEMLLVPGGWRRGVLLNILKCTGQPPSPIPKNDPAPNVPGGEIEKPSFTTMPCSASAVLLKAGTRRLVHCSVLPLSLVLGTQWVFNRDLLKG